MKTNVSHQTAQSKLGTRLSVWLLTNAPSPYQLEMLTKLAARLPLRVGFMRRDFRGAIPEISDGILFDVLSAIGMPGNRDELRLHPGALKVCAARQYDAYVLSGLYTSPTFIMCAGILWLRRKKFVMWLERPSPAKRRDLGLFKLAIRFPAMVARKCLLFCLFKATAGIVCMGELARQQYSEMGVAVEKLASVPYCCDVTRFQSVDQQDAAAIRQRYELDGKTIFLFSGQLVHRKGVDVLVRAFCSMQRDDVALVLLGDGPLRSELETMAGSTDSLIVFAGHQSQDELPAFFAASDVFVLPSRNDGWAVVINEACAAGLPVLTSKQTGAASDLVIDDENGYVHDCEDVEAFADSMMGLAGDAQKRERFGQRSAQLVQGFSVDAGAARLHDSIQQLTGRNS